MSYRFQYERFQVDIQKVDRHSYEVIATSLDRTLPSYKNTYHFDIIDVLTFDSVIIKETEILEIIFDEGIALRLNRIN
jgi:hypothetical protein